MKASRKTRFVRWIAAFVSIVLFGTYLGSLSMNTLTVSAICCRKDGFDKSRYTLTGNVAQDVATIAKSQAGRTCSDFGYSGVDYGAWCDEYVADCLENAGCDDSIVAHGGTVADFEKKMRKRGAVVVSSPQPGDLLFFSWSHVEIVTRVEGGTVYCAGGNNQGKTYPGGRCAGERNAQSVANSMGGSIRLYLRPNYKGVNPNPPTWATLSSDKEKYNVGETITFSFASDYATKYFFRICNENGDVFADTFTTTSYSTTLPAGKYSAAMSAFNESGTAHSGWINFEVIGNVPTYAKLSSDKEKYDAGETITFSFASDYATKYFFRICNENGDVFADTFTTTSYSTTLPAGKYSAAMSAFNESGTAHSGWINFEVVGTTPTYAKLSSDKEKYDVGETITFSFASDYATKYFFRICNENGDVFADTFTTTSYSTTLPAGIYSAAMSAFNGAGTAHSGWIYFEVVGTAPTYAKLSSDKETYDAGETITFSFASDYATKYFFRICNENGDVFADTFTSTSYSTTLPAGKYSAAMSAFNGVGTAHSGWINFEVLSNISGDCDNDGNVTIADVIVLQNWILNNETKIENVKAADLNADGIVNALDLALLRQKLA